MVGTNRKEKEVFSVMTKRSLTPEILVNNSKWNNQTMSQNQDSALECGVQLIKGRKMHLSKSPKMKRRKMKVPNVQGACCCAANCKCNCLKCMCQSQKITTAGNENIIRARKRAKKRRERVQRMRKIRENSNQSFKEELSSSSLVAQLTELVNRNRQRATQKKRQEKPQKANSETNEVKSAEIQSVGTASLSIKNKSQPKDPEPSSGSPANDVTRVNDTRKHYRKRKRHESSYSSRTDNDFAKPKGDKYQTKKRRTQEQYTSHSSASSESAASALAKIRRIIRKARDKNYNLKPPKKRSQ